MPVKQSGAPDRLPVRAAAAGSSSRRITHANSQSRRLHQSSLTSRSQAPGWHWHSNTQQPPELASLIHCNATNCLAEPTGCVWRILTAAPSLVPCRALHGPCLVQQPATSKHARLAPSPRCRCHKQRCQVCTVPAATETATALSERVHTHACNPPMQLQSDNAQHPAQRPQKLRLLHDRCPEAAAPPNKRAKDTTPTFQKKNPPHPTVAGLVRPVPTRNCLRHNLAVTAACASIAVSSTHHNSEHTDNKA